MVIADPYNADDLGRIAAATEVDQIPQYWINRLQEAAQSYLVVDWAEHEFLFSKKERRQALLLVAEVARAGTDAELAEAMEDLDYDAIMALPNTSDRAELAEAAEHAAQLAARGGRKLLRARRHFVTALAAMYLRVSPHRPTRQHDAYAGRDDSLFLEFCQLCLAIIKPRAVRGLADEVRSVVGHCRSCKHSPSKSERRHGPCWQLYETTLPPRHYLAARRGPLRK